MNYSAIKFNDIANGPGVRVTLFVSGCSHHCKGCHNPQTWNENNGQLFDESTKKEIFKQLEQYYISGITLSGGDPLYGFNTDDILEFVTEIKEKFPNKTIWIYSGFTWEEVMNYKTAVDNILSANNLDILYDYHMFNRKKIIEQCDVFVDGRYKEELKDITLKWKGSSNQRVIDIQKSLNENKIILYCD